MKKIIQLAILLAFLANTALAANWYARPAKSGTGSGTDWTNAFAGNSIPWGSVAPGDTVYFAGGSYGKLSPGSSGASGKPIAINRVLARDSAATSAAGWNSSFDSQVKFSQIFIAAKSFITISGRVKSGILVAVDSYGGNAVEASGSISDITFSYIELFGPPNKTGLGQGRYGFNVAPNVTSAKNMLLDHCWIHQWCEALRSVGWDGVIIQYCTISDTDTDNIDHADVIYNYPNKNVTWRYNSIFNSPVDGIFHEYGGAVNFKFYGNIYWNSRNHLIYFKAPGTYGPIFIYNNIFYSPTDGNYAYITTGGSTIASGSQIRNNVFYNTTNDFGGISDYNAYCPAKTNGYSPPSEAHSFTYTGQPFVNPGAGDFHLTSAGVTTLGGKGVALAAEFNKDMDGNTRGSNGGWDIGAFESTGGNPSATPSPTATPVSSPTPTPSSTPSPTSTPVATPTPTPQPSTKFKVGDEVSATALVNVRSTPAGILVGNPQPIGYIGTITAGPVAAMFNGVNVNWWNIAADTGASGWIGEDNLAIYVPTPTPTPVPTATPTATPSPSPTSTPSATPTPTPEPTATPMPSATPIPDTFVDWSAQLNEWLRTHQPSKDISPSPTP